MLSSFFLLKLEAARKVAQRLPVGPGGCPEAARKLPGGCLKGLPEVAQRLPRGCPEAAQRLPEGLPIIDKLNLIDLCSVFILPGLRFERKQIRFR